MIKREAKTELFLKSQMAGQETHYKLGLSSHDVDTQLSSEAFNNAIATGMQQVILSAVKFPDQGYLLLWKGEGSTRQRGALLYTQSGSVAGLDYQSIDSLRDVPIVKGKWSWLPSAKNMISSPGLELTPEQEGIDVDSLQDRYGDDYKEWVMDQFRDKTTILARRRTFVEATRKIYETLEPGKKNQDIMILL